MIRPLALALLLSSSLAFGATPTIDQLLSMKSVSRPRISPDGRLVAYELAETDWKENAYVTHIWLADVQSGRAYQLTRGRKSSDNPQWSPDGRWLAFMTERESASEVKPARQIWLISPAGGEAWQLTKHGAAIDSFRWSDDSRFIAFTAPVPETQAAKDRKEKYSDFEVVEEDFEQNQLWTVDVAAATDAKQITKDPRVNVGDFDWSPDGKAIAFSGGANPLIAFDETNDLYLADLAHDNAVKKIVALPGPESDPRFSPDGRELAFNTSLAGETFYYANARIATVRVADVLQKPATDVTNLTAAFDEDATILDWAPAGIYFRGFQKTASHLFRLDPQTKAIARVTAPDEFYLADSSFSRNFDTMAYTAPARANVTEVYVGPLAGPAKKLTDMMAQYAGLTLGSAEVVSWKSKDGATIEGVLRKPANYDASKKYPLLVVIHGGPTGVSRPIMNPVHRYYPIELFLAKGALVLEPNYRGSAGYGEQFRTLNVRNLGVGDMWDVMSGIDSLVAKGIADPDRLGSMGWSQGGYISAFLTTNTDRFKAISVGAGISNWMTYYVNTDITPFTRQYLKATPWDDPKIYADTSPMTNIRNAKTPTLIQHGQNDKRVPPPNAFELYRGLRDVGVPARLIVYAGFGHAINKPKSNRAVLQHNYDWFTHYIFGEPFPKDSPLFGRGVGVP
ncbi:MAG TPA: S9 family peptidase [Thermoanaerobaculia bacterium]|nr:S9 family peptidase [Thermoanaerobaculia bacterium]